MSMSVGLDDHSMINLPLPLPFSPPPFFLDAKSFTAKQPTSFRNFTAVRHGQGCDHLGSLWSIYLLDLLALSCYPFPNTQR